MSLMRRRAMMEGQKQEENVIYVDSGFLDASVMYDEHPFYNASYPDAWATTFFNVTQGDTVFCEELYYGHNGDVRIRQYVSDGKQHANVNAGARLTITYERVRYCRLMYLYANAPIPSQLTVTHTDGTVDTYKIVDRR